MFLSFHDLAQLELNEAASYYERESPGLGVTFVAEVERCAEAIVQYPDGGIVILGSILPDPSNASSEMRFHDLKVRTTKKTSA